MANLPFATANHDLTTVGNPLRVSTQAGWYKTTDYWHSEFERSILWSDPAVGVNWGLCGAAHLAEKDKKGVLFADAEVYTSKVNINSWTK
jgi:hypothetical protein